MVQQAYPSSIIMEDNTSIAGQIYIYIWNTPYGTHQNYKQFYILTCLIDVRMCMALHQERKLDPFEYAHLYEISQVSEDKLIFIVFHTVICL